MDCDQSSDNEDEECGDDRDHLVNPLVYFDLDDNTTIQIVPSDKFEKALKICHQRLCKPDSCQESVDTNRVVYVAGQADINSVIYSRRRGK